MTSLSRHLRFLQTMEIWPVKISWLLASALIFFSRTPDTHTNVKVNEKKIVPNGKNKKQSENPNIFTKVYLIMNFNIICKILNHELFPALQFF